MNETAKPLASIQPDPALPPLINPLLASEWGLIRALRALAVEAPSEGLQQAFKRLRLDSVASAAALARLVRDAGAGPTDEPSASLAAMKNLPSFEARVAYFIEAQERLRAACEATAEKVSPPAAREALLTVALLHAENATWLKSVLPR